MWLQPILSPVARALTRVYHRLSVAGGGIPREGPVLLVANHPNSLIDPAVVVGVAGRPVRFLAKHTLFRGEVVSWIVRGAGSIPVYRQVDAAGLMHQNQDAFAAVFDALAEGGAVGIFPEGLSHSGSSLAPLKTGAARIAVGAAQRLGATFPIIPIGLTFERRDAFRSRGLVVIGDAVPWDDLAGGVVPDAEAVRELTARIDAALRRVTVNLEDWDDAPIVHTAEAVYAAETGADPGPHARILRLKAITDSLHALRTEGGGEWESLARDLTRHDRRMRALRLRPPDLRSRPGLGSIARWTTRNVPFFGLIGLFLVMLGSALFWPPYRAVAFVVDRLKPLHDTRSTYKLVAGLGIYTLWWVLLTGLSGWLWGWRVALGVALALPVMGVLTLELQERFWRGLHDARRFWVHRTRPAAVAELAERQRELAARLEAIYRSGHATRRAHARDGRRREEEPPVTHPGAGSS
jgi:glycerol-3-phosphate O-acyltransferase / dihydroxyacetone phosphate acyltransferase